MVNSKGINEKLIYLWLYRRHNIPYLVSPQEEKWSKELNGLKSHEYKLSRTLIRKSLSKLFNVKPLDIPLFSKPGQPPKLAKDFGYISLSHCKDANLIGWYSKKIGIDIERKDRKISRNLESYLFFLGNEEKNNLENNFNNYNEFILSSWTAKESAIKWERSSIFKSLKQWKIEENFEMIHKKNNEITLRLINIIFKEWIISAAISKNENKPKYSIFFDDKLLNY
tara:strand:+ start:70354 stop:71028 length:675 start_codon:yes stop_codon:yes gene_type:complete